MCSESMNITENYTDLLCLIVYVEASIYDLKKIRCLSLLGFITIG